jgi:tRNA pseudouridine55 synthase
MPVFIVDKPLGLSSHDVVARARKLLKTRRVGHAGTLDPLATGVLVVLSEGATKLSPFLTASDKHYLAWVSFGGSSPTLDAEGPLERVTDASGLTEEAVREALPPFLELREQPPPQYSAVKKGGVKGYEAARKGETLTLAARPAGYEKVELLALAASGASLPDAFSLSPRTLEWRPHDEGRRFSLPEPLGSFPTALFSLQVRSGTYIRAFARDLGEALGLSAHLSGLVRAQPQRTRAGSCGLEAAISLDELPHARGLGNAEALPLPLVTLSPQDETRALQGKRLELGLTGLSGLIAEDGHLVAVAEPVAKEPPEAKVVRAWAR